MMKTRWLFGIAIGCLWSIPAWAQIPATAEHEVLKKEVGTWKAEMKMWMGADGQPDPNADPMVMEGQEVNRLIGEFWVVSDFSGDFGGMPFTGHSVMGFNPETKKFSGVWVDSMNPFAMHMEGTFDKNKNTMTSFSVGRNMEGKEQKGKSELVYKGDDQRVLTMYDLKAGTEDEYVRTMQITYTRVKE